MNYSFFLSTFLLTMGTIVSTKTPVAALPSDRELEGCHFSNLVAGQIGLNHNGRQILGSNPNIYDRAFSSQIDLTCSTAIILTISDPIQISGLTKTNRNVAIISTPTGLLNSPSGSGRKSTTFKATGNPVRMKIDIEASSSTLILSGKYAYKVMMTITPN
jgi:hypothetical protein